MGRSRAFYVPEELHQRIRERCEREGTSMRSFVLWALERALRMREYPKEDGQGE